MRPAWIIALGFTIVCKTFSWRLRVRQHCQLIALKPAWRATATALTPLHSTSSRLFSIPPIVPTVTWHSHAARVLPPHLICWMQRLGKFKEVIIVVMAGILWLVQWVTMVFVPSKNVLKSMSFSLAKIRPKFKEDVGALSDYIPRLDIEKQIMNVHEKRSLKSGTYFVMYGPKGAGKSSSVARVLGDKVGVIKIPITQGDTASSILENVFELCGLKPSKTPKLDDLSDVLRSAAKRRKGLPVTVVFEVERGWPSPEVLSLVKQVSKHFALDANVLIILSEANAVLGFGDDQRQEFIWVNEMSRDEAWKYVRKRVPSISQEDFNSFADNIGTLPLSLSRLCDALLAGQKVDDFIRSALAWAEADLVAFLHKPILTALKKSPEGVSVKFFDGVKHEGVLLSSPKLVAPAMKITNAIIFDFETGQYKLFSKAHQTALKTYNFPKID